MWSGRRREAPSRPSVFSLEGVNPLVAGGHWIPDLLRMAGGSITALEPGCNARRLEWREVLEARPEKLFVDLCSSDVARHLREAPWLAAQEGWRDIPAVEAGEVYLIDHTFFSCPGPRIVTGLEILAQLTHPELFSGFIPPGVVAKLDAVAAVDAPPEEIAQCFFSFSIVAPARSLRKWDLSLDCASPGRREGKLGLASLGQSAGRSLVPDGPEVYHLTQHSRKLREFSGQCSGIY